MYSHVLTNTFALSLAHPPTLFSTHGAIESNNPQSSISSQSPNHVDVGVFPEARRAFQVTRCNQCAELSQILRGNGERIGSPRFPQGADRHRVKPLPEARGRLAIVEHDPRDVARQAMEAVTRLLEGDGVSDRSPLIVISPSPSRRWKAWPIERWAEVADALADRGTIVIAGARGHQRLHAQLVARMQNPAIDLTGCTTLSALVALLHRAALHIAHDSGSVHIAAALGTRVVALYGPTSPSRLAPDGQVDAVVSHGDLCGPECPAYCLRRRRCLSAATPDEIVTKARQALAARAAGVPAPSHMTVSAIQPGRVADER